MTVYVDADACPVKDEVYKVAARYGARVYVVANGFMVVPKSGVPGGFARFIHEVVPVLQYRGLMRKEYAGPTMRENLLV